LLFFIYLVGVKLLTRVFYRQGGGSQISRDLNSSDDDDEERIAGTKRTIGAVEKNDDIEPESPSTKPKLDQGNQDSDMSERDTSEQPQQARFLPYTGIDYDVDYIATRLDRLRDW
jgi:hypothetical protein